MKYLLLLLLPSLSYASFCGKEYKGISVNCTPRYDGSGDGKPGYCGPGCSGDKYHLTTDQIEKACIKYINQLKFDTRDELYCNPKAPDWCIRVHTSYECHQMTGGPLSVDGSGNSMPSGFVFRKKLNK